MRLLFTVWGGMCGERTPYEDLFIAGAELACRQHAETVASFGHEVIFACLGPRDRQEVVGGVHLMQRRHPLAGRRVAWQPFWEEHFDRLMDLSVEWTSELIREREIEAIYTRVLWPTGVLGHRLQSATGVPCAATVDDRVFVEQLLDGPHLLPGSVRGRWAEAMTAACENLARLILLARHLEAEVRRFTSRPTGWEVIPSGLDVQRFRGIEPMDWASRLGIPRGRVRVICAARLDWPKRQDLLIEAVGSLVRAGDDIALILLGTGEQEGDLRRLAVGRGLGDRVHFLGYQPNAVVPAALLGADVVCAPTEWEAFPIQLLEGLASGKPMVVSDAPPYNDVLTGQDVIAVCPNDVGAWTAALREVLRARGDAALGDRRRSLAHAVLSRHTQEATSRRIEAVLSELGTSLMRV